jgi:hypothetical protein
VGARPTGVGEPDEDPAAVPLVPHAGDHAAFLQPGDQLAGGGRREAKVLGLLADGERTAAGSAGSSLSSLCTL